MEIEILAVYDKTDLSHERIVLLAKEDCNLWPYILFNTAPDFDRYSFIFPNSEINKGDTVTVYSKEGSQQTQKNPNSTKNHIFYWGMKNSIWKNPSDKVMLVKVTDYKIKDI